MDNVLDSYFIIDTESFNIKPVAWAGQAVPFGAGVALQLSCENRALSQSNGREASNAGFVAECVRRHPSELELALTGMNQVNFSTDKEANISHNQRFCVK